MTRPCANLLIVAATETNTDEDFAAFETALCRRCCA